MSTKRDTRSEILKLTRELVQSRGFNSFSYQDLASGLGIRKASVHYHFPSKDDLGVALLEAYQVMMHEWVNSPRVCNASPELKLDCLFAVQLDIARSGNKICPIGILSSEWNILSDGIRTKLMELMAMREAWFVKLIHEGREAGVFTADRDPTELARLVFASIQGAIQIARVRREPALFEAVARQLKLHLLKKPEAVQAA